jgi:hypothetical protein
MEVVTMDFEAENAIVFRDPRETATESMVEIMMIARELKEKVENLKPSRERSHAYTKLEEFEMWISKIRFQA